MDISLDQITSHLERSLTERQKGAGVAPAPTANLPYRVELGSGFGRAYPERVSHDLPDRQDSIAERLKANADAYTPRESDAINLPPPPEDGTPYSATTSIMLNAASYMLAQQVPDADTARRLLY